MPPLRLRVGRARGRHTPGTMNALERAYADHLELRRRAGEVAWYSFEAVKLRLAAKCYYAVDFLVMLADGGLECHEVKGYWEDDARVKIKAAAEKFPFVFLAVTRAPKRQGGGWQFEEF